MTRSSSEREWNDRYDEAMQWRDWQECDLLLEERERADWYRARPPWYVRLGAYLAGKKPRWAT